jgi:hypothetical protein
MPQRECKSGWINQYNLYTKPQQSPTIFHTWVAISVIGAALGRRVWMPRGYYTLFPNLYTILVSSSGVGNKTTAAKIGVEDILAKALPAMTIMRGSLTVGFLVDWMTQAALKSPTGDAELTVLCEEFKVFAKGLYADSGLIENLTKLYDCGIFEYNTKGRGIYKVEKPCVNMIACSTPEWLTTGSAADFIGGGFSSRIIPVALVKNEKIIAWPEKTAVEKNLEQGLIKDLSQIGTLSGGVFVTQEAKDFFEQWYRVREEFRKNPDRRLDGFYSKKHDMVLKVAMILAASQSDDLVVTVDHIEMSLALMEKLEQNIPFAFQGVAWGEQAKFQDKVLIKIREQSPDGISHKDLLKSFHHCMSGKDLKEIISTLLEEEAICWDKTLSTKKGGRPGIIYKERVCEKCAKKDNCVFV